MQVITNRCWGLTTSLTWQWQSTRNVSIQHHIKGRSNLVLKISSNPPKSCSSAEQDTLYFADWRVPWRRTVFGEGKREHGPGAYSTYIHKNPGNMQRNKVLILGGAFLGGGASKFTFSLSMGFFHIEKLATFVPNSYTLSPKLQGFKMPLDLSLKGQSSSKTRTKGCFSHGFRCGIWCTSASIPQTAFSSLF